MAREVKPTTETTETTEIENSEMNIREHTKHPRAEEFDVLITKYFEEKQEMPFVDIKMSEDDSGQVNIDMKDDFHEVALKQFGGDLDEILGDYVTSLIKSAMEDMTEEDMHKMAEEYAKAQEAEAQMKESLEKE